MAQIQIVKLPGFSPSVVELVGGFHIICGSNGTGKTRLLSAILDAVEKDGPHPIAVDGIPGGSSVEFIDPFWLLQKQKLSFGKDPDLKNRIVQAGLTEMRDTDQRIASYLLGRSYERIQFAELDATDDAPQLVANFGQDPLVVRALNFREEVVPYFVVTRYGRDYDSTQLSQGELAALTLVWSLAYLSEDSFVCIDEPESYLAPQAANRCLDVLALYAGTRKSIIFASSHSYLGLASIPHEHLLLLRSDSRGDTTVGGADSAHLWETLRVATPKPLVFAVEDRAAKEWLGQLLRLANFEHRHLVQIIQAGDAPAVRRAANYPSSVDGSPVSVWGFLDGDERTSREKVPDAAQLFYLPRSVSPENVILETLRSASDASFDLPDGELSSILAAYEGDDPHQAVQEISKTLDISVSALRDRAFQIWSKSGVDYENDMRDFNAQLKQVILPVNFLKRAP